MNLARFRDASLVLVRHGTTTWVEERRFQGTADVPLSARGRTQASAVGARLADPLAPPSLPIPGGPATVIRHSPLARAADTADAIGRARGTPGALVADDDLREIGHGAWEGLRHDEVMTHWPDDLALWRRDPVHHHAPGGESVMEASARASRAVERLLDDVGADLRPATHMDGGGSAVLAGAAPPAPGPAPSRSGHEPWAIVVAHDGILRLTLLRLLELPLERYWSFPFVPCAVTVVEIRDGRARLRAHNLEHHLAGVDTTDTPGRSGR